MRLIQHNAEQGVSIVIYGASGIGKSTLASLAPNPVFIDIENGLRRIDCKKTPIVTSWPEFCAQILDFMKSEYTTCIVDTIDALEAMLHKQLCVEYHWKNIEAPGYGKGFTIAAERWLDFLSTVDKLLALKKNIILISHEMIKSISFPDQDTFDRYMIKINKVSSNLIVSRMDAVLFAQMEMVTREDKTGERILGVATGKRVLRCTDQPAWVAKNRFNLQSKEPMDATIFDKCCFARKAEVKPNG